jgi:SPP1 gp7 family putative phage head morphogenesis protein
MQSQDPEGYYRDWSPFFPSRRFPIARGQHRGAESARAHAMRARRAESEYARNLRKIARHIGDLVRGMAPSDGIWTPELLRTLEDMLGQYADILEPWAAVTAERILSEIARRDAVGWHKLGREIYRGLRREIADVDIKPMLDRLLEEQVRLIQSLPREASERVHQLGVEAITGGKRWEEVSREIFATGEVTKSRANLIGRTEVSRTAGAILEQRSINLGSEGYIWRSSLDRDVRPRHKQLEGTFHRWSEPPIASEPGQREMRYHPGGGPNCRCWSEVVLAGETPAEGRLRRNPEYLAALRAQGYTTGTAFE